MVEMEMSEKNVSCCEVEEEFPPSEYEVLEVNLMGI
jgi:hypothetical protein